LLVKKLREEKEDVVSLLGRKKEVSEKRIRRRKIKRREKISRR